MSKLAEQLLSAALLNSLRDGPAVWLVGGALRDHFAQRAHPDRDFAVAGNAIETARAVADQLGAGYFTLDPERDAGRVVLDHGSTLDFVRLRGKSIEADLSGRDFTINALATPLHGEPELIDPLGGLRDLREKRLRACSPQAVRDDPVRALRGVRLAHELRFKLPADTRGQIRQAAPGLQQASPERVRDELARVLRPRSVGALRLAQQLGCLAFVLPEAAGEAATAEAGLEIVGRLQELLAAFDPERRGENFATAQIGLALGRYRARLADHLEQRLPGGRTVGQILFLAALYWPAADGASAVRRRARALHFSRREAVRAGAVVGHADPEQVWAADSPLERYRYLDAAGQAASEAVLLALAIGLAGEAGPPPQADWERQTLAARELLALGLGEVELPQALVDGDQLMQALGMPPGPQVGRLLRRIREAQIEGRIERSDQAIELARQLLAES